MLGSQVALGMAFLMGAPLQTGDGERDCFGVPKRSMTELAKAATRHSMKIGVEIDRFDFQTPEVQCRDGEFIWIIVASPKPNEPPGAHGILIKDADLTLYKNWPAE